MIDALLFLLIFSLIVYLITWWIASQVPTDTNESYPSHPIDPAVVKTLQTLNQLSDERSRREWQMKMLSEEYLRKMRDITRS